MDNLIITSQSNQLATGLGEPYLKFQLQPQTFAAVSTEHLQEVILIPVRRITPVPNMAECILGLLNRRNRILWVIDLAQMLNLETVSTNAQDYHIAIIRVGEITLGLVVQQIQGVVRFASDYIKPGAEIMIPELVPYVDGYIDEQQGNLLLLNTEAIVNSPILHNA